MKRWIFLLAALLAICPIRARAACPGAGCIATHIDATNAAALLFGGTDADCGMGDWYLSNGVVEACIDDAGFAPDLLPLGVSAPIQNEAAPTGGNLLDLGSLNPDGSHAHNDQLAQVIPVAGLSRESIIQYADISASTSASAATVTAEGTAPFPSVPGAMLAAKTDYRAAGNDPFLTVTTTITNTGTVPVPLGNMFDAFLWNQRGPVPFAPLTGRGFNHPVFNLSNPAPALGIYPFIAAPGNISPQDGVMDTVTMAPAGEVSYAVQVVEAALDPDGPGGSPPVFGMPTLFGINNNITSAVGNLPVAGVLEPGGTFAYTRRFIVGARNDVASSANIAISSMGLATGTISGKVQAEGTSGVEASIVVTRAGGPLIPGFPPGTPTTHIRTDRRGIFQDVLLPVGQYELKVSSVERPDVTVGPVTVNANSNTDARIPTLAPVGQVEFEVMEDEPPVSLAFKIGALLLPAGCGGDNLTRRRIPARLTFKGVGNPDPEFGKDMTSLIFEDTPDNVIADVQVETFSRGTRNAIFTAEGEGIISVRPGTYDIFASRGLEYTADKKRVTVGPGGRERVRLHIRRVVDTPGFLSADFHVHSARSFDASAPLEGRVIGFAAEGVEVIVASDHDFLTDYSPLISALGLEGWITSLVGDEVTTVVLSAPFPDAVGHHNGWPLSVDPHARRRGAIEDEFVAPNFIYSRLRARGADVIQLNHPRTGVILGVMSIGLFDILPGGPYDPTLPITAFPNSFLLSRDIVPGVQNPDGTRNIDFDVMEIINGLNAPALSVTWRKTRRDWLSLLNQGIYRPGTGVSDSHRLVVEQPGYARTYVGAGDDPASLNISAFNAAVKAGRMVATSGPYIEFTLENADGTVVGEMGETVTISQGPVTLNVRVQAAPWIPVEELRVIANGFVTASFDETTTPSVIPPPDNPLSEGGVVRFDEKIPVDIFADTYFIVEAGAKLPLDPNVAPSSSGLVNTIEPGVIPVAFTNPIFVDRNGDGDFDPPGLPVLEASAGAIPAFAQVKFLLSLPDRKDLGRKIASMGMVKQAVAGGEKGERVEEDIDSRKSGPEYFPWKHFEIPEETVKKFTEQPEVREQLRLLKARQKEK